VQQAIRDLVSRQRNQQRARQACSLLGTASIPTTGAKHMSATNETDGNKKAQANIVVPLSQTTPSPVGPNGCTVAAIWLFATCTLSVAVLSIGTWGLFRWLTTPSPPAPMIIITSGPTVTQIQSVGLLTVLKVNVSDILEATGDGYKGIWIIRGDALIAVDCRSAGMGSQNSQAKTAEIVLPEPTVLQPRVDLSRTREWSVEKTSWIPFVGDQGPMRTEAMRQAQLLVEHAVNQPSTLDEAKKNAVLVVENMYRLVGWNVTVKWSERQQSNGAPDGN
jgi:Protein of unknown function (DUF4230)